MSSDIVLYDSQDSIATITLNRPDKLNALSNTLVGELRDAFIHFEASEDRVAVLTGAGERAFSAGADLRDPPRNPELWECMPGVGVPLTKPTIAAVAGHCVGGVCAWSSSAPWQWRPTTRTFPTPRRNWDSAAAS